MLLPAYAACGTEIAYAATRLRDPGGASDRGLALLSAYARLAAVPPGGPPLSCYASAMQCAVLT
eukprot:1385247-Rhodomonas_salina.3